MDSTIQRTRWREHAVEKKTISKIIVKHEHYNRLKLLYCNWIENWLLFHIQTNNSYSNNEYMREFKEPQAEMCALKKTLVAVA